MGVHNWKKVEAGTFHHFHTAWITHLSESLNDGLMPPGYYAMAEQHVGRKIADVLTLHVDDPKAAPKKVSSSGSGGPVALLDVAPRVSRRMALLPAPAGSQRTLTIRHSSNHRIVALLEIVSPSNKGSRRGVEEFTQKVADALRAGIHVVFLDLFVPGRHDPTGMHGAVLTMYGQPEEYDLPSDKPLTLASYVAGDYPEAFVEHLALGEVLPPMPLFLTSEHYLNLPLEETYTRAYRGVPAVFRERLEEPA